MPPSVKDRLQQKIKNKKEKEENLAHLEQLNNMKIITDTINKQNTKVISVRFGDFVLLNFDRITGKLDTITDTKLVLPIPEEIKWLFIKDIIKKNKNTDFNINKNTETTSMSQKMYFSNEIGGIIAFESYDMLADNCPDTVSLMCIEKVDEEDRMKINIIITLRIDDTYVKKNDILDIIYSNNNRFWVVLKHHVGTCRLVYYYKPDYDALDIKTDSEEYLYTETIINHTFICCLGTNFNVSPTIVHVVCYDENHQILILNLTVANIKSLFPEIILYTDINKFLYDKGQFLGYCVNNNISAFSVILKKSETEKVFYTGILALSNPDVNKHTKIKLEFTEEHKLHEKLSLIQCMHLIYKNMRETELYIIRCTYLENKEIDERKELLKKEKLADENFKKILEEEEAEKLEKEKKEKEERDREEKNKIIEFNRKQKIEESKRILEEAESKRIIMYEDITYIINYLLDNVMDKVTVPEIMTVPDTTIDTAIDTIMYKILDNIILKSVKSFYKYHSKEKIHNTSTNIIEPNSLVLKKPTLDKKQVLEPVLGPESFSIHYVFKNNMYVLYPSIAYALENAPSKDVYLRILINEREAVMKIIDYLVITHPFILKIKKIIDSKISNKISNKIDMTAIYGSYLSIIYSIILNSIGLEFNPFAKYENPLYEVDIDTMSISFLSDEDMSYGHEFSCDKPTIISYHTDNQPVQNTNIKTSSISTLLNNCWDINSTSAILLVEKNNEPYIMRNPDFTDFLFGIQPIQLIFGKNLYNLYNLELTEKRLLKAYTKWY